MEEEELNGSDMDLEKTMMTFIYIAVFLIGTPGNLWIIYKLIRAKLWEGSPAHLTVSQRSRCYICALACSDLILLLTLPLTANYNYKGTWIFGEITCYVHLTIEIITKLFSVVLLTVMSLERYFIVCTRLRTSYRAWMTIFPLGVGTVFCVLFPATFYFHHVIHHTFGSSAGDMESVTVCIPDMDDESFDMFAQYLFFVGFVIPFCIMTFCYLMLVRHVRRKFKMRKVISSKPLREPRYMHEMRKSIWRIAVFHFVCWAPYWLFTIVPHYFNRFFETPTLALGAKWYVYCRLFANCLPYINAAGNWILYAVLNYDVRKHIYSNPKKRFGLTSLSNV